MSTSAVPVRTALHVRSISRWAPACIGPYSQANVLAGGMVLLAGQIGLSPQAMELVPGGWQCQLDRAVRNNGRVLGALGCGRHWYCLRRRRRPLDNVLGGVIFVSADTNTADPDAVSAAQQCTTALLREHDTHASRQQGCTGDDEVALGADLDFGTESEGSGSDEEVQQISPPPVPPLLVVVVPALPKGAAVEIEFAAATDVRLGSTDLLMAETASDTAVPGLGDGVNSITYRCQAIMDTVSGFPLLAVATVFRHFVSGTSSSVDMSALGTVVATALQFAPVSDPEADSTSRATGGCVFSQLWVFFDATQLEEKQLRAVLEGIWVASPALSLVPVRRVSDEALLGIYALRAP